MGNLAVRASHGDQAQDLELSSCQAALLQATGSAAAEALVDLLAGCREIRGGAVGERARAELPERVVGAGEALHPENALAGGNKCSSRACLRQRPLEGRVDLA